MIDLLSMGEPMLEFSRLPASPDGRVLYLEGFGGDTSNAAIACTGYSCVAPLPSRAQVLAAIA